MEKIGEGKGKGREGSREGGRERGTEGVKEGGREGGRERDGRVPAWYTFGVQRRYHRTYWKSGHLDCYCPWRLPAKTGELARQLLQ